MGSLLLAIDTATSQAVLALGERADGRRVAEAAWPAAHAHAETLLPRLDALLREAGAAPVDITGVVVGLGPGGFTGLRVGLATAKTIAHGLGCPIVGIGTGAALASAAGRPVSAVALPAGPRDRYVVPVGRAGAARLLSPSAFGIWLAESKTDPADLEGLLAVDLEDPALPGAVRTAGAAALMDLGAAMLRLGAQALAAGRTDDASTLVPAYVALPRGVGASSKETTWSPDLR